jgi:hypothetical protein
MSSFSSGFQDRRLRDHASNDRCRRTRGVELEHGNIRTIDFGASRGSIKVSTDLTRSNFGARPFVNRSTGSGITLQNPRHRRGQPQCVDGAAIPTNSSSPWPKNPTARPSDDVSTCAPAGGRGVRGTAFRPPRAHHRPFTAKERCSRFLCGSGEALKDAALLSCRPERRQQNAPRRRARFHATKTTMIARRQCAWRWTGPIAGRAARSVSALLQHVAIAASKVPRSCGIYHCILEGSGRSWRPQSGGPRRGPPVRTRPNALSVSGSSFARRAAPAVIDDTGPTITLGALTMLACQSPALPRDDPDIVAAVVAPNRRTAQLLGLRPSLEPAAASDVDASRPE